MDRVEHNSITPRPNNRNERYAGKERRRDYLLYETKIVDTTNIVGVTTIVQATKFFPDTWAIT